MMGSVIDILLTAVRALVVALFPGEQAIEVTITFASGRKPFTCTVPAGASRVAVEEPPDEKPPSPQLRKAILRLLEERGKRLTLTQIQEEIAEIDQEYTDTHLKNILRDLRADEFVNNQQDAKGKGYGLVNWPGEDG